MMFFLSPNFQQGLRGFFVTFKRWLFWRLHVKVCSFSANRVVLRSIDDSKVSSQSHSVATCHDFFFRSSSMVPISVLPVQLHEKEGIFAGAALTFITHVAR